MKLMGAWIGPGSRLVDSGDALPLGVGARADQQIEAFCDPIGESGRRRAGAGL